MSSGDGGLADCLATADTAIEWFVEWLEYGTDNRNRP